MRVGITGNTGFIGRHVTNFLSLKDGVIIIPFERECFENINKLQEFVNSCDIIIHLAGVNRHDDQQELYDINIGLVNKLCECLYNKNADTKVLFSSSTQIKADNLYGLSKYEGAKLFDKWSKDTDNIFLNFIVPNVFGPFGKPFYNSVVATFCYQTTHGLLPTINNDSSLELIYVNELVEAFYISLENTISEEIALEAPHKTSVTKLADKLIKFKTTYIENNEFPDLSSAFDLALFNTFRCYIDDDHYPVSFIKHTDNRGSFIEIVRANTSGQFSYSTTIPGITRGEHFHTRKAERFSVIKGSARVSIRKIDTEKVVDYYLDENQPSFIDMPIWHTHNITNIGDDELICLFWINEAYNENDPDTYFVKVREEE